MSKIIIAPDSFKGTLSAVEVCEIISSALSDISPERDCVCIPMSDGGEGMVEAYLRLLGGERRSVSVSGPRGWDVDCPYGLLPGGRAVAEMAGCAGLPLMEGRLDPLHATSRGVGQLIGHLASIGCRELLLGIGGSATNDCGVGMAAALGYRFLDAAGQELEPYAFNIGRIRRVCSPESLPGIKVTVACDVDNPLCGDRGASRVFGPQKGLSGDDIPRLDGDIHAFGELLEKEFSISLLEVPGAGAAGGLGAALLAFLKAELRPGIDILLDAAGMDQALKTAELVVTGEGRLDGQSLAGKVPVGVSRRAKKAGVPCVAVCGCLGDGVEAVLGEGICAYYPAGEAGRDMEELKKHCRDELYRAAYQALSIHLDRAQ